MVNTMMSHAAEVNTHLHIIDYSQQTATLITVT